MAELLHLPGARLSPEVVLHRVLADVKNIKAVAVVIQYEDGGLHCDWSDMKVKDLCLCAYIMDASARDTVAAMEDKSGD